MKKLLVLVALLLASFTNTFGQRNPTELYFEKNRTRYIREHFAEGEDASSGFDYVYFRNGKNIVMIRAIWSASYTSELRVEDMYFDTNGLALFRRSTSRKRSMAALKSGRGIGLSIKEEMHFEKGKLMRWTQDGAPVSSEATSWPEAERLTLQTAKGWIDSYDDLKNAKQ